MKFFVLSLLLVFTTTAFAADPSPLTADFIMGDPQIKSVNALAFGPEGILFIGDSQQAAIIAIDTGDDSPGEVPESMSMDKVDERIAALIGTTADDIVIQDMAVNPISRKIYLAVHRQDGLPVLLVTDGKELQHFALDNVSHSKKVLQRAVAEDAQDRRGRSLRRWAISDLAYHDGKLMISGLSNEAFSSAFQMMPFPFKADPTLTTLEIYHAAHGRYETYAPIKTFMPYRMKEKDYLIASYTCTPLVIFPMDEVRPGQHTKGKTVAELGNRNTPLDIISYSKDGKEYLLLANTSRALMKIDPEKIAAYQDYLTEPVEGNSATAGVDFLALPYVNVLQMDKMDDEKVVFLQRLSNGDLNLYTTDSRRL